MEAKGVKLGLGAVSRAGSDEWQGRLLKVAGRFARLLFCSGSRYPIMRFPAPAVLFFAASALAWRTAAAAAEMPAPEAAGWWWVLAVLLVLLAGSIVFNVLRASDRRRLQALTRRLEEEVARATKELQQSHDQLERSHARLEVSHTDLEQSHVFLRQRSDQLTLANVRLEAINRELRETQVKLVQSEKMAALGKLVAGVAHELNTPLGVIKANQDVIDRVAARVAELTPTLPPQSAAAIERNLKLMAELREGSGKAIERVTRIVQGLRAFSRLDEATLKHASLQDSIESALNLLDYGLRNRELMRDYGELPEIVCNPAAINEVFMQLLTNARDATEGKPDARITVRTRRNGDWVEAVVEDNGWGIPEESLPRIFDPGFTTRGVGVGTGLGLAIVHQIVAEHGGEVSVRSRPGEGAAFTVRLPLARPAPQPSPRTTSTPPR